MDYFKCLCCGKENSLKKSTTNKYCNNKCQQDYQYKKFIEEWKKGNQDGVRQSGLSTAKAIKKYILEKQNFKCSLCGIYEWCGKPITLELEHIDGDSLNNKEENLCCLCPNCHSQTPTYKAKNKGKGRKARKPL